MRERDLSALDFTGVCRHVAGLATSAMGAELCRGLRPSTDPCLAEAALARTWECRLLIERHGPPPTGSFPDVRAHLQAAGREGLALPGASLVEVRTVLERVRECAEFLRNPIEEGSVLAALRAGLTPLPDVEAVLHRALDHAGQLLDQASDDLGRVRAAIRRLRDTIARRLEELVARRSMADVVADNYVTIRNARFVVPVRAGAAGRLAGIVQDRSVSGETFFIEPLFAVDLNNQLLLAVREEEEISRRILLELTALVGRHGAAIGDATHALAELDALVARARFSLIHECVRPSFTAGEIELRAARHPGLLCSGRAVVPVDLLLAADERVLVISGPNTGGKTVALKTLGLCSLMAQSGLPIPAAPGARLPCFAAVFTDIGDEQSIERDLSTFSAHVANLCDILCASARAPLILLDEPGVGTDPEEGAALAVGLLAHFAAGEARVAISTHYRAVKLYGLANERCRVAAVDFAEDTLSPRYRLVYDSLGRSMALPIAERLGLPQSVLDAARAAQSEESQRFAEALASLDASRRRLDAARREAAAREETLRARDAALTGREREVEMLIEDLRERRRRAWGEELREAREFVREIKRKGRERLRELQRAPTERESFARFVREQEEALESRTAASAAPRPAPSREAVQPGDQVAAGARRIRGELLSIDGERAWIQSGAMRFEVAAAELERVAPAQPRRTPPRPRVDPVEAPAEISLIGLRARAAIERLERFLDTAARGDGGSVRIVHGVGTGALRRAVHDYLAASPYCANYRLGEEGEGGGGVTVATLRD